MVNASVEQRALGNSPKSKHIKNATRLAEYTLALIVYTRIHNLFQTC
jgi:hypothetical protein